MSAAYGLCPVCGKVVLLRPVEWPKEPEELVLHLKEHQRAASKGKERAPTAEAKPARGETIAALENGSRSAGAAPSKLKRSRRTSNPGAMVQ